MPDYKESNLSTLGNMELTPEQSELLLQVSPLLNTQETPLNENSLARLISQQIIKQLSILRGDQHPNPYLLKNPQLLAPLMSTFRPSTRVHIASSYIIQHLYFVSLSNSITSTTQSTIETLCAVFGLTTEEIRNTVLVYISHLCSFGLVDKLGGDIHVSENGRLKITSAMSCAQITRDDLDFKEAVIIGLTEKFHWYALFDDSYTEFQITCEHFGVDFKYFLQHPLTAEKLLDRALSAIYCPSMALRVLRDWDLFCLPYTRLESPELTIYQNLIERFGPNPIPEFKQRLIDCNFNQRSLSDLEEMWQKFTEIIKKQTFLKILPPKK